MASAVAALILAGCAAEGDPEASVQLGDGSEVEFAAVEAGEGLGSITGVVVDEAIRPLAGANVSVLGQPVSVATDGQGLFALADLEPGLHTLSVDAAGYSTVQATTEVKPGETSKVRIVLALDRTPRPYHTTQKYDWYDDAGVTLVDFAVDLADRSFLNDSLPAACDVCYFEFTSDGPVDTFVIEAVWEDTVDHPAKETEFYWSLYDLDSSEYESDYFTSPGRAEIPAGDLGNATRFGISLAGEEEWITYQQHAQLFVSLFYLAPPPEGWSIVAGDT